MYLDKCQLYPPASTSIPHYWIPSHLPTQHPHIPTSRQSLHRQYRLVAYRHLPLHLNHNTHLLHAKSNTGLGTPTICKWRCTGTPEMLLLPSPVAMDSSWLPSHELDHWQLNNSPPNDLWKVNIPHPHNQGLKHWQASTHWGSALLQTELLHKNSHTARIRPLHGSTTLQPLHWQETKST